MVQYLSDFIFGTLSVFLVKLFNWFFNFSEPLSATFRDVIIAAATGFSMWFLFRRMKAQERNVEIQEESHMDQQYLDAIKIFSEPDASIETKLGAIYILESLAIRSPQHTQKCVDFLTQINETYLKDKCELDNFNDFLHKKISDNNVLKRSLEALRNIIGVVSKKGSVLNLSRRYLCGILLSGLNINSNINFSFAHLEGSYIGDAFFKNVNFVGANLAESFITKTVFEKCDLSLVNRDRERRYKLLNTNIDTTKFKNCTLNHFQVLPGKYLTAEFIDCDLGTVKLDSIDVAYFDFSQALNLNVKKNGEIISDEYVIDKAKNNHKCILSAKQKKQMGEKYKNNPEPEIFKKSLKSVIKSWILSQK